MFPVYSEGQQNQNGGKFSYGVIIGQSDNVGLASLDGRSTPTTDLYVYYVIFIDKNIPLRSK